MSQIREFAAMLCIAAVSCCALRMLIPHSALEPILRMILSAFFLFCLLSPLTRLPSFAPGPEEFGESVEPPRLELERSYEELVAGAVQKNLAKVVEARLEKMGAKGTNILVNIHAAEDGSIDISGIEVTLSPDSAALARQVRSALEEELELPVEVSAGPGKGEVEGNGA